jgi:hypothetical protein
MVIMIINDMVFFIIGLVIEYAYVWLIMLYFLY